MRKLLYMAHPLAPTREEVAADTLSPEPYSAALQANLLRALRWLAWLRRSYPAVTFIAPWISVVQSLDGNDSPALREAGLVDDCAVVERCDGIVLCGVRVSSGMARERDHGRAYHQPHRSARNEHPFQVYDLTCPTNGDPPLTVGPLHQSLDQLAEIASTYWRNPP